MALLSADRRQSGNGIAIVDFPEPFLCRRILRDIESLEINGGVVV
jgi:hypothetical protein